MDNQPQQPSDAVRNSQKIWRYLPAIEDALKIIQATHRQWDTLGSDFRKILQELLPSLVKAFNSEIAFCADSTRTILLVAPADNPIANKQLPPSERVGRLLEAGESLIITQDSDNRLESDALGVKSLLVVRLLIPGRTYFVGVCNGHDEPSYEGTDKKQLEILANILGFGLRYGHTQAESQLAYDRYFHAQRNGGYNFLSRASEDCARFIINLKIERPIAEILRPDPDNLLSDYLDAELCKCIQDPEPKSKKNAPREDVFNKSYSTEHLLNLVNTIDGRQFTIVLHDNNGVSTPLLDYGQYPRTTLAIARIGLWAGYIKAGAKSPNWIDENKRVKRESRLNSQSQNWLNKIDATDLFYTLPHKLIKAARPDQKLAKASDSIRWQLDWLRTLWQEIHYIARDGISEPRSEWIKEIDSIYSQVRPLTVQVLQWYLCENTSDGCLKVDSDWLAACLVSNVLLSKRLVERFGMENVTNGKELSSSPTEKTRYFTHLSHLVLYTLHCICHNQREKGVQEYFKSKVTVQRLPFAEVPIDLSLGLSETQLYILSVYAYYEIGVHRELALLERLGRQLHFELPLYVASDLYRDHLYHVIDVCLLGELLLRSKLSFCPGNSTYKSLLETFADSTTTPEILLQNWYIAALCHDLGYVVERAGNLLEPVRTINGSGLDEFWGNVIDGLDSGGKKIKQTVDIKLSSGSADLTVTQDDVKEIKPTDHGIASWLHLNHWLDQVHVPLEEVSHALNAILRHNLPEQKVRIDREPLTLLLMLCDHLQEWGRPRVKANRLAVGMMEYLRFTEQPDLDPKIRVRRLVIKGLGIITDDHGNADSSNCAECWKVDGACLDHCLRVRTRFEQEVEFELSHVEAREGDFEPAISWLLLCRDLQCFGDQSEALPFDIKITLKHTPSRIWHSLSWKPMEMDLLQEFASEYEPAAYLCKWIEKARRGDDGIHYTGDRNEGMETFTIHLNQLDRPLQRGLSDQHWKRFFGWKWQRLGQRFIQLNLGAWFPEF